MWIAIGLFLLCAWLVWPGRRRSARDRAPLFVGTGKHWRRAYGRRSFMKLGGAIAVSGLLAYSGADTALERWHRENVRSPASDALARGFKQFGERYWFLVWALLAATDAWGRTSGLSRWGRANFEAMVVGLPTLWTVQRALGANRPLSENGSPHWRPLAADNSASGHAFIGAIPWLHLARRLGARPQRFLARGASWLTGWSRLNDRKHYPGQIVLGWIIAWNAVEATAERAEETKDIAHVEQD